MGKQLFDHDPLTGLTQYFEYDSIEDKIHIHTQEDVGFFLDRMKDVRNDESISQKGIKQGMWHYASIPATIVMEMRKKGIDVYKKEHHQRMLKEINTNYPYLKATTKKHV